MNFSINHAPTFSTLDIILDENEEILAQPNSMISMTTGIRIAGKVGGNLTQSGVAGGIKGMLSGEEFFSAIYTSKRNGETISLAPDAIGEIIHLPLAGSPGFYLSRGAFLARQESVEIELKYEGLKGWMAAKGYLMHATGQGALFLSSFGAVVKKTLADGEQFVVDNRYVIAFQDSIKYQLVKATEELKHSLMSGEGLVNRYTGPGDLYYQTRTRQRLGGWVGSLLNMAS